ncbi:flavodoxin family protein [Desulfuromonas versatilis]|uniref:Flavodoxin family protein n=1 Tax=Desulfuromonas versatilis TaxID=2802975 RepID=A0ABM8HZV7_9BACT|nr:flavodoxin family protein [Desulfuromonas versatilis]BCR06277.1 flavodoxin family protein [Desulfuromonas versatilis]
MKIIGVSGSPIKNSNTDRAIKLLMEATGGDAEFIKLSDYTVAPCKGCLGCVATNRCVIKDDGIAIAEKIKQADVLIVGGFTPYSTLDARTKAFLERLYPLRHNHGYLAGKLGAAVVASCVVNEHELLPPACQMGINAIQFFMMEEGMDFVGAVKIEGNVPCIKCGNSATCKMDGIKMLYGADATVDSYGIQRFEEQQIALDAAKDLGRKIANKLESLVK